MVSSTVFASEQQDNVITVGYSVNSTNFISDIEHITSKGYGYDIFTKIEDVSSFKFEFVPIYGDLITAVENGEVDVGGFVFKTESREQRVAFSEIAYSKTFAALGSKDHDELYNNPKQLDGKTVSLFEDSIAKTKLDHYLEYHDVSVEYNYYSPTYYTHTDSDYYIIYTQDLASENFNNVLNLGVFNLHLISSHQNKDTLDLLNSIFYDIVSTEGNYYMELEEKYLAQNIELNHRSLNPTEVDILRQRPLEVGYIADYAPISFTNAEGKPDGFMVDLMNLFVEEYGFEVIYKPYSLKADPRLHEDFDVMLTIYGDGVHDYDFYKATESLYELPLYAQVRSTIYNQYNDPAEMFNNLTTIGSLPYDAINTKQFETQFPQAEIIIYNDWDDLLNDFANKELESIITTQSSATYVEIYLESIERVTVPTNIQIPIQFFISHKIEHEYAPIFNIIFDNFTVDNYRDIINSNSIEFYPQPTLLTHIRDNSLIYSLAIILIIFLIFFVVYRNQKKEREIIYKAYNTDSLTGLMSMNRFTEVLTETIKNSSPGEYEIISFDVDMFKSINLHYSEKQGTEVIIAIAKSLKQAFNEKSVYITRRIADQFIIARKKGDGGTVESIYKDFIQPRVRDAINDKNTVVMSFGIISVDNCNENISTLVGQVDSAKRKGKGKHTTTFITFDDTMRKQFQSKIDYTFRMEQALEDKEFRAVYQPKINFDSLMVNGAEALVRWKPKNKDTIYPNDFIPVFEENGFISHLDMFVLEQVCIFIDQNRKLTETLRLSVNLSGYTVLSKDLVQKITDITDRYNVPHDMLDFEITESALVGNEREFLTITKQLKKLGFFVSIDDFGAGVSSLNRLGTIEANILKLDKAFFDMKDHEKNSSVVVQDIISMAKHLDMAVVAEGVETLQQALWLKDINCDYAQGYFFEKPLEEQDFKQLLQNKKVYILE